MSRLPDGVGSIDTIYDCEAGDGILVRLIEETDLDTLLFQLAAENGNDRFNQNYFDEPTTLPGYTFRHKGREAQVGWFRKQPCTDGDHSWDMAYISSEKPEGSKARGAFLGVFLG